MSGQQALCPPMPLTASHSQAPSEECQHGGPHSPVPSSCPTGRVHGRWGGGGGGGLSLHRLENKLSGLGPCSGAPGKGHGGWAQIQGTQCWEQTRALMQVHTHVLTCMTHTPTRGHRLLWLSRCGDHPEQAAQWGKGWGFCSALPERLAPGPAGPGVLSAGTGVRVTRIPPSELPEAFPGVLPTLGSPRT